MMKKQITSGSRELEMRIMATLIYSELFSTQFYAAAKDEYFLSADVRTFYLLAKQCFVDSKVLLPEFLESKMSPKLYADCSKLEPLAIKPSEALRQLRDFYAKEKLKTLLVESVTSDIANPYEFIAGLNQSLLQIFSSGEKEESSVKEALRIFSNEQKAYTDKKGSLLGFSTGISRLDEEIDGIRNGHFWVIGGYTSTGKTFCVLNLAATLLHSGIKVALYSLEMSQIDIIGRMLGILSGVPGRKILKSSLGIDETIKTKAALKILEESGMQIYSKIRTLDEILLSMLANKLQKKADVFMVDYGQLMSTNEGASEYETLTKIATQFQGFAQQQDIPIILLSQISNESVKDAGGIIGFKGSGALAASADIAIILKSGEMSKEDRNVKVRNGEPIKIIMDVRKNRHGRCGEIDLLFDVHTGVISEQKNDEPF